MIGAAGCWIIAAPAGAGRTAWPRRLSSARGTRAAIDAPPREQCGIAVVERLDFPRGALLRAGDAAKISKFRIIVSSSDASGFTSLRP